MSHRKEIGPRPQCPNEWMTWFDRIVNRFGWWVCFHVPGWTDWVCRRLNRSLDWAFGQGLYNRCRRLSVWAAYRSRTRMQRRWARRASRRV